GAGAARPAPPISAVMNKTRAARRRPQRRGGAALGARASPLVVANGTGLESGARRPAGVRTKVRVGGEQPVPNADFRPPSGNVAFALMKSPPLSGTPALPGWGCADRPAY